MIWTDEQTDRLKELYAEGRTCSYIARDLGSITRNAVIGKIHRLGLPKPTSRRRRAKVVGNVVFDANINTIPLPELVSASEIVPEDRRKTLLELSPRDCRFPFGDPHDPDFHFCGARAVPTLPYCAHHLSIAYLRPPIRYDRVRVR